VDLDLLLARLRLVLLFAGGLLAVFLVVVLGLLVDETLPSEKV
jgi:hypothetical protein